MRCNVSLYAFCVVYVFRGGGTLFYIDSAQAETVNQTQETQAESSSFIVKFFNFVWLIISGIFYYAWVALKWLFTAVYEFFDWLIETFGRGLGTFLGFLGIGTPTAFIIWIVASTIKHFLFSHGKKYVTEKLGLNKQKPVYKRELDEYEIMAIADKYGFSSGEGAGKSNYGVPSDEEIYCTTVWAGFTWHGVALCTTGIYTYSGLFSPTHDYLSYFDLRNSDYMDMSYLKIHFDGFPGDFYNLLMELKEA